MGFDGRNKPWRKRENVGEQLAIGHAQGQRVGRAIGKSADADARRVDGVMLKRVGQRPVGQIEVEPVGALRDDVPTAGVGAGRHEHQTFLVGQVQKHSQAILGAPTCPVQQHEQRHRPDRIVLGRHIHITIAAAADGQHVQPRGPGRAGRAGKGGQGGLGWHGGSLDAIVASAIRERRFGRQAGTRKAESIELMYVC